MLYDELPEDTKKSLLRGYVEHSWRMPWLAEHHPELVAVAVTDDQAYEDGLRLRQTLDRIFSSDTFWELRSVEAEYDELARELHDRYGDGIVVFSNEPGEPGLRRFRTSPFSRVTETTWAEDGTTHTSVTDLQAELDAVNDADTRRT